MDLKQSSSLTTITTEVSLMLTTTHTTEDATLHTRLARNNIACAGKWKVLNECKVNMMDNILPTKPAEINAEFYVCLNKLL